MMWLALLLLGAVPQNLAEIKAENDPPKRAAKAIEYSFQKLADVRDLASASEYEKMKETLPSIAEGVEMALEAFRAKRNIGAMKKAEQRCRDMLRRLETLQHDLPVDQRESVEPVAKRVQAVQESMLEMILGRKR